MEKILVIDNDYFEMYYHAEFRLVQHRFKKNVSGEPFREMLTKGAEFFSKYRANKWLSDDREMLSLRPDDKAWAATDWFPKVLAAGWKQWAILLPKKIIGQATMKNLISEYAKHGVTAQIFDDPTLAFEWIIKQP